jgi:hypothetical protein
MLAQWPSSAKVFLPGGQPPVIGDWLIQTDPPDDPTDRHEGRQEFTGEQRGSLRDSMKAPADCFAMTT